MEVGTRGYSATSLRTALRKLGLWKMRARKVIKNAADAALRASFLIWLLRDRHKWELSSGFKNISSDNLERNTARVHSNQRTSQNKRQRRRKVVLDKGSVKGIGKVVSKNSQPRGKVVLDKDPIKRA